MKETAENFQFEPKFERHYEAAVINLRHLVRQGKTVFTLTSAWPAAGKTITTLYLGKLLADMGSRVLLIDGDFFRATLSKRVDLGGAGLTVAGGAKAWEAKPILGLDNLLGIGPGVMDQPHPEAIEWVTSHPSLPDLLSRFDCTLIDTPPLSASNDALVWAQLADGCVMVVNRKMYQTRAEAKFIKVLRDEGIPIVGVVLTRSDETQGKAVQRSWWQTLEVWLGLRA